MVKAVSLSSVNTQSIEQTGKSPVNASVLAGSSSSDFGELLSLISSKINQTLPGHPSENSDSKNNQLTLETSLDNISLKDLNAKLINDILDYLEGKTADYAKKSLNQSDIQDPKFTQDDKLNYLLSKLSKIFDQSDKTLLDKQALSSKTKNNQSPLEISAGNAYLEEPKAKLINDILDYLEGKNADYKPSKPLDQSTSKDLKARNSYDNLAQILSIINSIVSSKSDVKKSSTVKEDFSNTKLSVQNTNYKNKSIESKISTQQNSNGNNALGQENTGQKLTAFDNAAQILPEGSKDNNTPNKTTLNANTKPIVENAKITSQNTVNEPSLDKYTQNSQIKVLNYETKIQTSEPSNVKTNANNDLQAQNNNANTANSKYSQTMQDSVLPYKLSDNKSKTSQTNINNTNQQLTQNASDKININPKSLQQADQNTVQSTSALLKITQDNKETQATIQDKTKTDLTDITIKDQTQRPDLQTNSYHLTPQAKENVDLSSNMQSIIDKIAQMKSLNPPVIKTLTINVNPPSLGNIDLQVSIDSKKNLTANIDVQSQDLFNVLNKNLDSLKNTLQNQGFNISQISLNIKNDGQQSFYQNNQNQQSFNNSFLNFNQGSNNGNTHQQGSFAQTFNQNDSNSRQRTYIADKKQIISSKVRLNASIIDIDA